MPETEAETEATLATAETAIETKRTAKAVARKKVIIWGSLEVIALRWVNSRTRIAPATAESDELQESGAETGPGCPFR